ncbi:hypothetical protein BDB01DRAFT_706697, partial [Pilobolus umbonatus]
NSINSVKEHVNSNAFEKDYYKPNILLDNSTKIQNSIFYTTENDITLEVNSLSTEVS